MENIEIQEVLQFLKYGLQTLQMGRTLHIIDKTYLNTLSSMSKSLLPFNTNLIDSYVISGKHYINTMHEMSYRIDKLEKSNNSLLLSNYKQQQKFFTDTIDYLEKNYISEFEESSVIFKDLNKHANICILLLMKQKQIEQTIIQQKPLILIKRQVKTEMEEALGMKFDFLDTETFLDID